MTNCVKCGSEIPIKDVLNGSYRKVEGNPYHTNCAPAAKTEAAPAKSSAGSSASHASPAAKSQSGSSASRSSASSSGIRKPSASGVRPKAARVEEDEDAEERPRSGYVKKEDPTLKYVGIAAGIFLVIAGGVAIYTFTKKSNEDRARERAWSASTSAISYIRQQFTDNQEDSGLDQLEQIIKQKEPDVLPQHIGDLDTFKQELVRRREAAKQRKEFNDLFNFLKANAAEPKKAEEVQKTLDKADRLMGLATDAQKKDMATFKMLNGVAILEAHYQKALEVEQNPANKDNYPVITAAYQEAEEWFTGEAQSLIRSKVAGADRAKELYEMIQGKTNQYSDFWANSDKYGFKTATAQNLLDPKEFQKSGSNEAHWSNSKLANWKLDGPRMIAQGLGGAGGQGDLRAGVLFWGPNGSSVRTMANGKDIWPGTRETMRHYEVTFKFKVVKKGFTLLARHTGGYQRHAYGFETTAAQEETKAANKKAKESGKSGDSKSPSNDPFSDASPADDRSTNYPVEEGKSYEVIEQVFANKVKIFAKESGASDPEALEDGVRARYGGIGIQLLPGAEIHFESISVRILM